METSPLPYVPLCCSALSVRGSTLGTGALLGGEMLRKLKLTFLCPIAINVIMLGVFTLIEAITVGSVVSYFKSTVSYHSLRLKTLHVTLTYRWIKYRSLSKLWSSSPSSLSD